MNAVLLYDYTILLYSAVGSRVEKGGVNWIIVRATITVRIR